MQWLIDIIKELVHGQLGYFWRGDPVRPDFIVGDFIKDNTWRELDLSGIVPENTQAVDLITNIRATAANKQFNLRRKGQLNIFNMLTLWTQVANIKLGGRFTCAVDEDRKIEYRAIDATFNLITLTVAGWWLR